MPPDVINTVLETLNNLAFYRDHIPSFSTHQNNGSKQISCLCPFHDDKKPSLSVNLDSGLFNCFGCGEKGNPIQFLQKLESLSFNEAINSISAKYGIPVKDNKKHLNNSKITSEKVKIIHNQLISSTDRLDTFTATYGLTKETIQKYQLGYQNDKYVIPIKAKNGHYLLKEHKGVQTKGSRAVLYPHHPISDKEPIMITEGEFKCLLLVQNGFNAVCGTAGAKTWKQEWNQLFKDRHSILAYDCDEAGIAGEELVIKHLKPVCASLRRITWPDYMDGFDVTDFFIKFKNTRSDLIKLIDKAIDLSVITDELYGIKFVEPSGFEISEKGIATEKIVRDYIVTEIICHQPLFITSRAINIDSQSEEIEIKFRRDNKLKSIWSTRRHFFDQSKLISMADNGLNVHSCNVKKIIDYLSAYEAANINLIPKSFISKGLGWKTIDEQQTLFILPNKDHSKDLDLEFSPEQGFERFVNAMKKQGSFEKWLSCAESIMQYPYAAFGLIASFAAPLLKILNAPNFVIDYWGTTSQGKTTALEVAASVWGNPHKESNGLIIS